MSFSNVQSSGVLQTNSGGGLSWTPGVAPTLGNLLTARVMNNATATVMATTDVKDSSGTPVVFGSAALETKDGNNKDSGAAIYYLLVPSGLTTPLKDVNTSTHLGAMFDEWSGNDGVTPLDAHNVSSGVGNTETSGAITTGANAGLILALVNVTDSGSSNSTVTTSNFGSDGVPPTGMHGDYASRTLNAASQTGLTCAWSNSGSGFYSTAIASFNAVAVAPSPPWGPELTGVPSGMPGFTGLRM